MSTQDATLPFGQHAQPETAREPEQNNGKSNTAAAAVATGAAAAAVGAAGYYAYTQMTDDTEVVDAIVVDDDDEEVDAEIVDSGDPALKVSVDTDIDTNTTHRTVGPNTGTGRGTAVNNGTGNATGTQTDPVTNTGTGTQTDPGTQTGTNTGTGSQTGTGTQTGTGGTTGTDTTVVQDPPAPTDPIVDPQIDVHENPDEIADALIAVDEVDPDDIDNPAMFTFTDVDTVYDIYGNATTQANYYGEDGSSGVMIDLDGDGVFDEFTDDSTGTTYVVDDTFLTVGDAQLDAETGYIAYNEDEDSMIDDDPMEDIIDSGDFA